jgi:hypothetical protein
MIRPVPTRLTTCQRCAVPILFLCLVHSLGVLWLLLTNFSNGGDFRMFYNSAQGLPSENLNNPLVTSLFVPFTWLPFPSAFRLWRLISVALSLFAAWLLTIDTPWPTRLLVAAAVLVTHPAVSSMDEGQTGALLVLAGAVAWRGRGTVWEGLGLAALILLKPIFIWLLLPSSAKRTTILLVLGAVSIGILETGLEPWLAWVMALSHKQIVVGPGNLSLASLAGLLGGPVWLGWLLRVAAVIAGLLLARRSWLACGLAAIVTSPIGWSYYLLALVGPVLERKAWLPVLLFLPLGASVPRWYFPTVAAIWFIWCLGPPLKQPEHLGDRPLTRHEGA